MKTKGIRLTKDVLDAALAGGTILGGGGGALEAGADLVVGVIRKKAENMQRLQLIIQTFV